MNHFDHVSNDIAAYFSDSEDESLFCVKMSRIVHISVSQLPFNRRLLPKAFSQSRREKELYFGFLKSHFDLLDQPAFQTRNLSVYFLMGNAIPSESYAQCRVHHCRLLQHHGDTENIIRAYERKLSGGNGRVEKMQQQGLKVEVEEATEEQVPDGDLWAVLEVPLENYYRNEGALLAPSLFSFFQFQVSPIFFLRSSRPLPNHFSCPHSCMLFSPIQQNFILSFTHYHSCCFNLIKNDHKQVRLNYSVVI